MTKPSTIHLRLYTLNQRSARSLDFGSFTAELIEQSCVLRCERIAATFSQEWRYCGEWSQLDCIGDPSRTTVPQGDIILVPLFLSAASMSSTCI
ncbi:hypothetical protein BLNAU_4998 [Blattamonas nauphoetae]|uniref:Uncharacterized protein n=1 Tax=Blattamonas nauphoetae TaxID=2049346 RepID=A0ABQ9Y8P9_9EUKA|nr:hypothetical protein BLNAU_4998 [Blattamonas nauphoetae]